jgi:16S rRNA (cytosine1402-N4)-methyltransferase
MTAEVVECLRPAPGGIYVDATLGGMGHAEAILEASRPDGLLIGIDRDHEAIERAERTLKQKYGARVMLERENFSALTEILSRLSIKAVDGIVADVGLSSYQIEDEKRGFSFLRDSKLDMRMDTRGDVTAFDLVNGLAEEELSRIFREYGEERFSRRIASAIVRQRREKPIETTADLAELVLSAVPKGSGAWRRDKIHPATRVFQALRIVVNDELKSLETFLSAAVNVLKPGSRVVVISFHSLEDRIVKRFFREASAECLCPPRIPKCVCGHTASLKLATTKAIRPTEAEVALNPRARSARLRAAERVA